jgi:hypothetical protein
MRVERPGESERDDREGSARCVLLVWKRASKPNGFYIERGAFRPYAVVGPHCQGMGPFLSVASVFFNSLFIFLLCCQTARA